MPYDLHQRLGYKLTLAAQINNQTMITLLADIGLTRQSWCVLVAVGAQGISQPSAIADYVGIKRAAVSRSLKDMALKGLLERQHGHQSRQHINVSLTPEGKRLLALSMPMTDVSAAHLNQQLSSHEQAELGRLLDKILSAPHPPAARI